MSRHPIGILVYVPDNPIYLQELKQVETCVRLFLSNVADLIVCGPSSIQTKVHLPSIFVVHDTSLNIYYGYKFAHSLAILVNPVVQDLIRQYDYILRTDTDVFLTSTLASIPRDGIFYTGRGEYCLNPQTRKNIRSVSARFHLYHRNRHNIGSTWYAPTEQMLLLAPTLTYIMQWMASPNIVPKYVGWPTWHRGVIALYASEIAINHHIPTVRISSEWFDTKSTSTLTRYPPHIHCWQTKNFYSKLMQYSYKKYNHPDTIQKLQSKLQQHVLPVNEYCLLMYLLSKND